MLNAYGLHSHAIVDWHSPCLIVALRISAISSEPEFGPDPFAGCRAESKSSGKDRSSRGERR